MRPQLAASNEALKYCMPQERFEKFRRILYNNGGQTTSLLQTINLHQTAQFVISSSFGVSRITLRRILQEGLEDVVKFGKRFTKYEKAGNKVIAHFEDGTTFEGD